MNLFAVFSNYIRRISDNSTIIRNVFCYHRARSDHNAVSYRYPSDDHRVCHNADIISNGRFSWIQFVLWGAISYRYTLINR